MSEADRNDPTLANTTSTAAEEKKANHQDEPRDGSSTSTTTSANVSSAENATEAREVRSAHRPTWKQWVFLLVVALVTAGLDLWSKAWAIDRLSVPSPRPVPLCTPPPGMSHAMYQRYPSRDITLIRDYLDLRYAENCGGAWGFLHGANEKFRKPFFLFVSLGAVLFIVHLYRGLEPGQRATRWALPLVLGGAIGNLVDRMRLGYVVDFIDAHYKDKFHWPTFNVADIAITVGIGLMLLEYVIGPRRSSVGAHARPATTESQR